MLFDLRKLDEHFQFTTETLNNLYPKALLERLNCEEGLPRKPLTKSQRKKIRQREKRKNALKEHQLQNQREISPLLEHISPPIPSKKENLPDLDDKDETFEVWFMRTSQKQDNLKRDYRVSSAVETHKRIKAKAKQEKVINIPSAPSQMENKNTQKVNEKEVFPIRQTIKSVVHAPHRNRSKKLCHHHLLDILKVLKDGGYTLTSVRKKGDSQTTEPALAIGGNPWKVFRKIHDQTFSGEMDKVINLIRALGGFVDETRSGSRIGIVLRHIKTNKIVGTDLITLANE